MLFSSTLFLFGFLPLVLALYYLLPRAAQNLFLLAASLVFYAWGEVFYVAVMLLSIGVNYTAGWFLNTHGGKWVLSGAVAANLLLLGSFKYANFLADNLNAVLAWLHLPPFLLEPVHLPLGISFFTFQGLSYLVDVYRRDTPAQKNVVDFALYIALFPQLIAGPIVRYHDVAQQITRRGASLELFADGAQRFTIGLAKKMLIANPLGEVADAIFGLPAHELSADLAWIGLAAYALQIYFDFSGYSDMAIGLGRMFGFRFLENFNYPYIAQSIQEFWRRWHISLSTWFRDYLYIPLGGNRVSPYRLYFNLFTVFVLCGLWHGASWNFVAWGLIHGLFLAVERLGFGRVLARAWRPLRHGYALSVVLLGWVFFRAQDLPHALHYLAGLFGAGGWPNPLHPLPVLVSHEALAVFAAGALFAGPVYPLLARLGKAAEASPVLYHAPRIALLSILLSLSVFKLSSGTYNPFIYFRF